MNPADLQADPLYQEAMRIHRESIVIDGHNDVTINLTDEGLKFHEDGRGIRETDLTRLFAPRSVALVGATDHPSNFGGRVFRERC